MVIVYYGRKLISFFSTFRIAFFGTLSSSELSSLQSVILAYITSAMSTPGPINYSDSDPEITQEYLQSLLDKARSKARESANLKKALRENAFGVGEDVVKLDGDDSERYFMSWRLFDHVSEFRYRSLPPLDPGELPPAYFEFAKDRDAPATIRDPDVERAEAATSKTDVPAPPPNPMATGKFLTKKQRKAASLRT